MFKFILLASLLGLSITTFGQSKMPNTKLVNSYINFDDDLDFEFLQKAIKRQERSFKRSKLDTTFKMGDKIYKREHLYKSLIRFKALVSQAQSCLETEARSQCFKWFSDQINKEFNAFKPIPLSWERGYKEEKTHFTAYYSPDLHGSRVKTSVYKNPIYAMPKDSALKSKTSDEINYGGAFDGKGLELFYVKESKYDIWLLHVEGGGRVQVQNPDGTKSHYYLSYAGSNKRKFQMLYRYMLDNGMLRRGEASIANQRKYFVENPEHQREILASCPSFIYFKVTTTEPLGVRNIPLTEQRSLATDYRRTQEYGMINFIQGKKPVIVGQRVKKVPYSRFFLNQDTGGAIKGYARSDLYFGYGKKAELAANFVNDLGKQYFLILK